MELLIFLPAFASYFSFLGLTPSSKKNQLALYVGNKNYSSWSLRPWLLLKVLNIDFEEHVVKINGSANNPNPDNKAISGSGLVPSLHDGSTIVWDSLAIVEYVAESCDRVYPKNKQARAVCRSICCEMHSGFSAMRNLLSMNLKMQLPGEPRSWPVEVQKDIDRIVNIFASVRKEYGKNGPFLFGEFSAADAFYAPVIFRFATYNIRINDPIVQTYIVTMLNLKEMKEWKKDALATKEAFQHYDTMFTELLNAKH